MRISDWSSDVCSSDLATDHTESIGHARLGAEVVHLVVEQEAGALDHYATAVIQVEGVGVADRVAIGVDEDRKCVVSGKSVSVRVDLGGRRLIQKKNTCRLSYKYQDTSKQHTQR